MMNYIIVKFCMGTVKDTPNAHMTADVAYHDSVILPGHITCIEK